MASVQSTVRSSVADWLLPLLLAAYGLAVVGLHSVDQIDSSRAFALTAVPILLWGALRQPGALVLLFVALPPGWVASAPAFGVGSLTLLFTAIIAIRLALSPGAYRGLIGAVLPLVVLIGGSYLALAQVDPDALRGAVTFRDSLVMYVALFALAYILTREGKLSLSSVGGAILLSAAATGLIFLWQTGFQPWTYRATALSTDLDPGFLFYRTHFGYIMATGFAVALARVADTSRRSQGFDLFVLGFFSVLLVFSFARGAWLVALVLTALLPLKTGKALLWLLVPIVVVGALSIPGVEERLTSDIQGGIRQSFESGDFATGRWGLWQELWDRSLQAFPGGQGFGYIWDLSPTSLFGSSSFTSEDNPFVYAHNDFLYWMVELGVIGLAAMVFFWGRLAIIVRKLRRTDRADRLGRAFVGGIVLTMFVASMADNGLFIRSLAERFFIVAGAAWAAVAMLRQGDEDALDPNG